MKLTATLKVKECPSVNQVVRWIYGECDSDWGRGRDARRVRLCVVLALSKHGLFIVFKRRLWKTYFIYVCMQSRLAGTFEVSLQIRQMRPWDKEPIVPHAFLPLPLYFFCLSILPPSCCSLGLFSSVYLWSAFRRPYGNLTPYSWVSLIILWGVKVNKNGHPKPFYILCHPEVATSWVILES